jgi:CPA1 family monovalent cation:H+ antiporter
LPVFFPTLAPLEDPIRSELFGIERLEQHAASLTTAVAIATRRLRIPYTVALMVVGLWLGAVHVIEPPRLTKSLLFDLILPDLIFEASFKLGFAELKRNARVIAAVAVPGVVVAIGLTGVIAAAVIHALAIEEGFSLRYGIVFGALIAATDPIAVVALFRKLEVPRRLATLVEGESLLDDGTSIVFLTLILRPL